MDPTHAALGWTIPDFLWILLADANALIQRIQPLLYNAMLFGSLAACLLIRFGPPVLRPFVAVPFIPTLGAALWMGAQGRPELFWLALMASCPLMLWLARAMGADPMRSRLLDLDSRERSAPP